MLAGQVRLHPTRMQIALVSLDKTPTSSLTAGLGSAGIDAVIHALDLDVSQVVCLALAVVNAAELAELLTPSAGRVYGAVGLGTFIDELRSW